MKPVIDPRRGDVEDDASSTKRRSLLSLAGSLLAEISLPKLAVAWFVLIVGPGLVLGVAPVVAAIWLSKLTTKLEYPVAGIWPLVILAVMVALGWFGGRTLFRLAENSFWSLNSLAVQPAYTMCREALRQLAERRLAARATKAQRARLRAAAALVSGALICAVALAVLAAVLPSADLIRGAAGVGTAGHLAVVALANTVVLVAAYLAVAALVWAIADATMAQPQDLDEFAERPSAGKTWRVAHLSDVHGVGERYGFRIESGRSGASGNERLRRLLAELDLLHAERAARRDPDHRRHDRCRPLERVGRFHGRGVAASRARRANADDSRQSRPQYRRSRQSGPARSADQPEQAAAQAAGPVRDGHGARRARPCGRSRARPSGRDARAGADAASRHDGQVRRYRQTGMVEGADAICGPTCFPMVLAPERDDGLGIVLLDSNADTHFSFTNALGMISTDQTRALESACAQYPRACWIVALHHHVVEYPRPAKALSVRIGTALVNGNWFVRRLKPLAHRIVLMHGHRHIDWIGECGGMPIISAPSPVMEATDDMAHLFLHPHLRGGGGRASQAAAPATDHRGGRAKRRGLEPAGSV